MIQPSGPSTQSLDLLPGIGTLRRLTKSIAMLDAIICPDWESRYFSFNSRWDSGEEMASMRDGEGDEWFLLFFPAGAALKGFSRDTPLEVSREVASAAQAQLPKEFSPFLREPAFAMERISFCIWRAARDEGWSAVVHDGSKPGAIADGSRDLLWILDGNPRTYWDWATSYYERDVHLPSIEMVYRHQSLDEALVRTLNPHLSMDALMDDVAEIGYPVA